VAIWIARIRLSQPPFCLKRSPQGLRLSNTARQRRCCAGDDPIHGDVVRLGKDRANHCVGVAHADHQRLGGNAGQGSVEESSAITEAEAVLVEPNQRRQHYRRDDLSAFGGVRNFPQTPAIRALGSHSRNMSGWLRAIATGNAMRTPRSHIACIHGRRSGSALMGQYTLTMTPGAVGISALSSVAIANVCAAR
jgi:hypothetical protein